MASIAPSALATLNRVRCQIFQTAYNPTSTRTGAKYLRKRLRGPSMMKYYPPYQQLSLAKLMKDYPEWDIVDEEEQIRLRDVEDRKKRGKGAPTKAKNKEESRRTQRRR
ncbi:hypothetical protein NEOLEDRAFT_1183948 [Neolentinus lepideus HHB14362 ss-1]|uniref:Small ribosomal subunit protein mS33 n=1 Tax=Neolentinus lepideus HHB14362 ss-1 TaxID=1314782 RepID=A0A165MV95_9AGAM|nr:hypothetical protein NEOLEDRAFT_1183948 [Neolentinus lepideus HHB14362 ss-1]